MSLVEDALKKLFNYDDAGALYISNFYRLLINSRTYNDDPLGTYRQYVPIIEIPYKIFSFYLPFFKKNDNFRTNIGIVNFSSSDLKAKIELYNNLKDMLSLKEIIVKPNKYY